MLPLRFFFNDVFNAGVIFESYESTDELFALLDQNEMLKCGILEPNL